MNPAAAPPQPPPPRQPQPRRHCTLSMAAGAAFLIASALATGVADAVVATAAMPAATAMVATSLLIGSAILLTPYERRLAADHTWRGGAGANPQKREPVFR